MHAATVHAADHCDGARTDAGQLRGRIGCKHATAFDGTYTGVATQNISQGNTLDVAGGNAPITCQNYGVPPPLTIHNGLAQFQLLNYSFQGYVTPQGHLKMDAGYGQVIDGQMDNQGVYRAQGVGACAYTATWRKSAASEHADGRAPVSAASRVSAVRTYPP